MFRSSGLSLGIKVLTSGLIWRSISTQNSVSYFEVFTWVVLGSGFSLATIWVLTLLSMNLDVIMMIMLSILWCIYYEYHASSQQCTTDSRVDFNKIFAFYVPWTWQPLTQHYCIVEPRLISLRLTSFYFYVVSKIIM